MRFGLRPGSIQYRGSGCPLRGTSRLMMANLPSFWDVMHFIFSEWGLEETSWAAAFSFWSTWDVPRQRVRTFHWFGVTVHLGLIVLLFVASLLLPLPSKVSTLRVRVMQYLFAWQGPLPPSNCFVWPTTCAWTASEISLFSTCTPRAMRIRGWGAKVQILSQFWNGCVSTLVCSVNNQGGL